MGRPKDGSEDRETPRGDQDRALDLYNKGQYSAADRDATLGAIDEHLRSLPGQ